MKKLLVLLFLSNILFSQKDPYFSQEFLREFEEIPRCWNQKLQNYDMYCGKKGFIQMYMNHNFDESPNDIKHFAGFFFWELQKMYGEEYPNLDPVRLSPNKEKINFSFYNFNNEVVAIAKSPGDRNFEIVIDPKKWDQAFISEKTWIIFHELAHEFFNTKHGEGSGMMFPISPGRNISISRLWNGWNAMAYWLVKNKKEEIEQLHIPVPRIRRN